MLDIAQSNFIIYKNTIVPYYKVRNGFIANTIKIKTNMLIITAFLWYYPNEPNKFLGSPALLKQ